MLFKETKAAAEAVAVAVSEGAEYHAEVSRRAQQLKSFKGWTLTDDMRFSVECQDKVFQLLRMYRTAYAKVTSEGSCGFPTAALSHQPKANSEP